MGLKQSLQTLLYVVRGDYLRALAAANNKHSAWNTAWKLRAYYRLRMYAKAADFYSSAHIQKNILLEPLLVSLAACGRYGDVQAALCRVDVHQLPLRLRCQLSRRLAPFMPDVALQLLDGVEAVVPPTLWASLLLKTGQYAQAEQVIAQALDRGGLKRYPELGLYQTMAQVTAPQEQLARLNAFLQEHGVPALTLQDTATPPNPCNVVVADALPSMDGPLVTVLMTTFRTGERASVAIQSLLNQTYRNLEIIVVDDASDDATLAHVQAWASRDARVRVLRLPVNGGTYLAKSLGLQMARGEFVTCHDSDDWSHPLKIERQVRPLLEDASLVATTSSWLRMRDDGVFYAWLVHPLLRFNPSSPLFRREQVLKRMGAWDLVRTGADSEFHARLKLVFGASAIKDIQQPLALGAHREGSLMTSGDTGYSAAGFSGTRLAYLEAWAQWHIECLRQGKTPALPCDLRQWVGYRPFAVPSEIAVPELAVQAALAVLSK